jgi:hypothetical protein
MTPRVVRLVVMAVCVAGIAGMIAGSIADNNAVAMTFGLATAVAVLCLIVVNAVVGGPGDPELTARDVEYRVERLVEQGADEGELRALVRAAVKLGRAGR